MLRRPGDLPEFTASLVAAQEAEQNRLLAHWMTILFGRDSNRLYTPEWHNDDTCNDPYKLMQDACYYPQGEYDE